MYLLPIFILILRPLFLQVLVRVMLLSWKRLVKVSIYWHFWFHGISSFKSIGWENGIFGIELGLGCGGGAGLGLIFSCFEL